MYVTFFFDLDRAKMLLSIFFHIFLSTHYFEDVFYKIWYFCVSFNCAFYYVLNTKELLYQYQFQSSRSLPFCIFVYLYILKRSKGVTCESRQGVTTLDRRTIFFFCTFTTRVTDICHPSPRKTRVRAVTCCRKWTMTKSEYLFTGTLECILLILYFLQEHILSNIL